MIQVLKKFVSQATNSKMVILLENGHNGMTGILLQGIGILELKSNVGHLLQVEIRKSGQK